MADLFRFRYFFGRKKKNPFSTVYFTAEKVKSIFSWPLVSMVITDAAFQQFG